MWPNLNFKREKAASEHGGDPAVSSHAAQDGKSFHFSTNFAPVLSPACTSSTVKERGSSSAI